jgi:hypothetical protein
MQRRNERPGVDLGHSLRWLAYQGSLGRPPTSNIGISFG